MPKHSDEVRAAALAALAAGQSLGATSRMTGVPKTTLSRWKNSCDWIVKKEIDKQNIVEVVANFRRDSRENAWWWNLPKSGKRKYVYLVRESFMGYIKIGMTSNLPGRFSVMDTSCPQDIELLAYIETEYASHLEKFIHLRYSNKLIKGEWFALEKEDIRTIIDFCGAVESVGLIALDSLVVKENG